MNLIFRKNFKNAVERVLHVPHNYTGGILEMTFVLDYALSKECAVSMTKEIAAVLRSHSQVFQNVRLNLLHWKENEVLVNQVVPISMLQLGRGLENYESLPGNKSLDTLTDTLKRFHARSKLVICLLGTGCAAGAVVLDEERTKKNLQPFLGRKSIFLCVQEDGECVSPEIVMGAEILSKI
ncbi:hypothetical protein LC724_38070 [Blautia sp. RD014234]|nr:hypothetical protein [Blautia parvula]